MEQPPAIPVKLPHTEGWQNVPIEPSNEPLVPLGIGSSYLIYTDALSFGERVTSPYSHSLPGSLATIFVRRGVAERLIKAEAALPAARHLVVCDGYRPLAVQGHLYQVYLKALQQLHADWPADRLARTTQAYVSLPSDNPAAPSPHYTGGAIDVALYDLPKAAQAEADRLVDRPVEWANVIAAEGQVVDFGVPLDYGGLAAALNYYEQPNRVATGGGQGAANRRQLYQVMTAVGFEPYQPEWWHYNAPETQMGARTAELPVARYSGLELSAENLAFEKQRQDLLPQLHRQSGLVSAQVISPPNEAVE